MARDDSNRLADMIFSRPLIIESSLPPGTTRARVHQFAASRDLSALEAFRRRQIVGWRLSESHEDLLFQPEYGDSYSMDGARFVGLVEPADSGSRIRGRVVVAPLTRVIMSVFMLAVVFAVITTLVQGTEPATKVLTIASTMLGVALLMLQFSVRSTSRLVEARLRQCLETREPRAVA
ncbi:MAG TPA: hypothetical protein VJN70_06105 [Gemmatimonadaceae bacterium]|nr:hypothetical protein [Gemmatimonadaceae bacterium]